MLTSEAQSLPVLPRNPCRTCGRCCRSYAVPVNGQDIWRIWRSQRLAPVKFVVPVEVGADRPDAFKLSSDGVHLLLILDKQGVLKPDGPCVFLMRLPGGYDRCAIYNDRPVACRAYPMVQSRDRIEVNPKALCPSNSWTEEDTRKPAWRRIVRQADLQYDVYSLVVAHWNEHVERHPTQHFDIEEFLGYVFNVYERIVVLDQMLSEVEHEAIESSWGHAAAGDDKTGAVPWMVYVESIQEIVSRFYPVVNSHVTSD